MQLRNWRIDRSLIRFIPYALCQLAGRDPSRYWATSLEAFPQTVLARRFLYASLLTTSFWSGRSGTILVACLELPNSRRQCIDGLDGNQPHIADCWLVAPRSSLYEQMTAFKGAATNTRKSTHGILHSGLLLCKRKPPSEKWCKRHRLNWVKVGIERI
ncbi:hypothetical protein BC832DRAFT_53959 [Gaertneriomyces semiglobifer]|nr:hypothetical protein BC832DRAFT_53959 [Gaertneriomyces semiglobifer]